MLVKTYKDIKQIFLFKCMIYEKRTCILYKTQSVKLASFKFVIEKNHNFVENTYKRCKEFQYSLRRTNLH